MSGGPFGHNKLSSQTPVMTAGIYSANDALGGLLTFQIGSKPDNGGVIMAAIIIDKAKQTKRFNLVLFNQEPAVTADNTAYAPTDQNLEAWSIGHIPIDTQDWASFSNNAMATKPWVLPFNGDTLGRIYGQLQELDGGTYTATNDITVKLSVLLNT